MSNNKDTVTVDELKEIIKSNSKLSWANSETLARAIIKSLHPSPSQGLKWVKASERLPDSWHLKLARFTHTKIPIVDIPNLISTTLIEFKNVTDLYSVIEWLDESPASNGQSGVFTREDIIKELQTMFHMASDYIVLKTLSVRIIGESQWEELGNKIYNYFKSETPSE